MATCVVDVAPQSLAGLTCGRLLRNGVCPVHGEETTPSVFDHPDPNADRIIEVLNGEGHQA